MTTINNNYPLHLKHIARAYDLERLKRYDLALQEVKRALDLDPHSAEAHSCGAWILRQSGRLDAAEEAARTALSHNPMFAPAHNVLACILWSKGNLLEAEQAFEAAIALQDPGGALYITNYARMMLARRHPQDALALADRALVLAPSRSIAHEVRGEAFRVLGEHTEAIAALRQALSLDARNARAHNSLGQVQLAQGRVDEAQDSFRTALRLQPGEGKVQANLVFAIQAQYPLYGRLLALTMRANTTGGRVYFLWVSVITLLLVLFLPAVLDLAYDFRTSMVDETMNPWLLIMLSLFAGWLLAVAGRLIVQPFFNLLLRLDTRNRAVIQFEPADVAGATFLLAAVLGLLAYGVLLVSAGPFAEITLTSIHLAVAGLIAVLLSVGMRGLDRARVIYRWGSLGSYVVLVCSLFVIAVGSALDMLSGTGWEVWLFISGLVTYSALWAARVLDARQLPLSARRALNQWLLGIIGIAFIALFTAIGLGLDLYAAVPLALFASFEAAVVTSNRTVRNARVYRKWVTMYGEVSAQNRIILCTISVSLCLAVIALAFHYMPAG